MVGVGLSLLCLLTIIIVTTSTIALKPTPTPRDQAHQPILAVASATPPTQADHQPSEAQDAPAPADINDFGVG